MEDPCKTCLINSNCSNCCIELIEFYNYLSAKTRANLLAIPGITKKHLEEFEKLETRGEMLVKFWKNREGIND